MRTEYRGKQLTPETARKFAALTAANLDADGMARSTADALNAKRVDLRNASAHLTRLTDEVKAQRTRPDDRELVSARKRVEALSAEVQELEPIAAARRARAEPIARLHSRASSFLSSCPPEALLQPARAVTSKLAKNESESEGVERLRKSIADLRAEIRTIDALPRAMTDIRAQIAAEVEALAEEGRPGMAGVIGGYGRIDWNEPQHPTAIFRKLVAVQAWADPAGFRARLEAEVSAVTNQDGPTAAERAATVAELDRKCLAAEREEEALLERLEAKGFSVSRRGDMDLRAALALGDDAPVANY